MGVRQLLEYIGSAQLATFDLATVHAVPLAPTTSFGELHGTFDVATVHAVPLTPPVTLGGLTRTFDLASVHAVPTAITAAKTYVFDLATVRVTPQVPQVTYTMPVWEFSPPVVYTVPRVLPDTRGPAGMLFRHYANLAQGQTVLQISGEYVTLTNPSAVQLEQATKSYIGGHVYEVSPDDAAELTAAGYEVTQKQVAGIPITPAPPVMPTPTIQTRTFDVATVHAVTPVLMNHSNANRSFEVATVRAFGVAPTAHVFTGRTFEVATVHAVPVAPTATRSTVGPLADDFNGSTLDTSLWTFEDPVGGSSVAVAGGVLQISVAGGVDHDSYSSLLSPRVYQHMVDADFYVEAKMNTSVTAEQESMGFLVTSADEHKWVRAIFYRDTSVTRVYAAFTLDNGATVTGVFSTDLGAQAAPLWMRLYYRVATHAWTVEYSTNGSTWVNAGSFTADISPARMAYVAGNSAPGFDAWTATFDYLHLASGSPVTPPPPTSGRHLFGGFRFGASAANLATVEGAPGNFGTVGTVLVHGPRGSWANIQAVGFSGIGDFPGRKISYTADIIPPGFSFVDAANGLADSYWFNQVNQIVNVYNHPDADLRPGHEFNLSYVGEWYAGAGSPWTPAQYVAMCRRYIQVAKSVPNQRLTFTWCYLFGDGVNVFTGGYYWGDDVTDNVGPDLYNRNTSSNLTARWNNLKTHYNGLDACEAFALAHNKKIVVGEWMNANYVNSPSVSSGDDTVFATNMPVWIAGVNDDYHVPYFDDNPEVRSDFTDFPNTYAILHAAYAH